MNKLAQNIEIGNIEGPGAIGAPGDLAGATFGKVISGVVGIMTIIAAIWFLFNIITGGIAIINAGSDKAAMEGAKGKITNGVVGLIVVIAAFFIVQLLGYLLGIDSFLDVEQWIDDISNRT